MIKKLLMAAAVVAMAVPAAAQGSRRSEVSVSYGVAPVTDWIDSYSDMLTGLFTNANTDLEGWGAVTVGYSFRLIGSLRSARRSSLEHAGGQGRRLGDPEPLLVAAAQREVELDEPQGGFVLFAPRCGSLVLQIRGRGRERQIHAVRLPGVARRRRSRGTRRGPCRGRYRYVGLPAVVGVRYRF